ncbi:hypothetical protein P7567_14995, partial [Staphylococcus aureus]|nr:hypothetical protein [Staphylococcus aureus]
MPENPASYRVVRKKSYLFNKAPLTSLDNLMTTSKLEVLTPANCQMIFIDHQPQMAFGVQSID